MAESKIRRDRFQKFFLIRETSEKWLSTRINPHTPVAHKVADEVVFRRFQCEEVEFFFKSDLTDPCQILDSHLLEDTNLSPSSFHFLVGFISRSCFESDGFIRLFKNGTFLDKMM